MARYKILTERDYADSFKEHDAFALDVLVGLSGPRKFIPSKYFYDARGSELFDQITRLPEYYPTACELEIIERHLDTIVGYVASEPFNLVELGAGFSTKTTTLLEYFHNRSMDFRFVPIDISESAMQSLTRSIAARFSSLEVDGLVTDYFNGLKWLNKWGFIICSSNR